MIPVYQQLTVANNGMGDCFKACLSSILEIDIKETHEVTLGKPGVWYLQWQRWCRERGYKLEVVSRLTPPNGYSIASVITKRFYPVGHVQAGQHIVHACVALNGVVVHDPYEEGSDIVDILYFSSLEKVDIDKK